MITIPTVLILGAGASMPYGFPSGIELLLRIAHELRRDDWEKKPFGSSLVQYSNQTDEYSIEDLEKLGHDLFCCGQQSIDVFLAERPDLLIAGKVAIARALIPQESPDQLISLARSSDDDWYHILSRSLRTTKLLFKTNRLSIITFNYDRSLEQFLLITLCSYHGMSPEEGSELLRTIPIVHVHGNLGSHPYMGDDSVREYSPDIELKSLMTASSCIKIISESDENSAEYGDARNLINNAEIICFLGFGFDHTNMYYLSLEKEHLSNSVLFGTTLKLGDGRRHQLSQILPLDNKLIQLKPCKSHQLLHEHNVLEHPWHPELPLFPIQ